MANSAAAQTALPIKTKGVGVDIIPYLISIDTVDSDLTIKTPTTNGLVVVVGLMFSETNAQTLTFKSGTTTQIAFELAPYQGLYLPLGQQVYLSTQPGEALKIRSSAAFTSALIYVAETSRVNF